MDGTNFNHLMASCFQQMGEVDLMLDMEVIPKRGKELPVSETLVKRLKERYGNRFVDLVMGDALYMAEGFINACKEDCGIDVLVKTDEVSLNIIKEAIALFQCAQIQPQKFREVEIQEGVDTKRCCSYKICAASGFHHEGIDRELKIAYVEEHYLKTKKETSFFSITTMTSLKALDMRNLGHERWSIETNGFNEQCDTKHLYSHKEIAQTAVILILFIAFNVFNLFMVIFDYKRDILPLYGAVKLTKKFFVMAPLVGEFCFYYQVNCLLPM